MKSESPFMIKWCEGSGEQQSNWWLKSVPPDGFFGEITLLSPRMQTTLEGKFLEPDIATLQESIRDICRIRGHAVAISNGDQCGLLALGTLTKPEVIYRYREGAETTDECARLFLKLIGIARKYVESITESAKSA